MHGDPLVHGFFIRGIMRGGAELRPLGANFPREAEVAVSVEKPWQSHGVGSALLRRTLLAARNRGYRLLHIECLADNVRMQQLARKFHAHLSFDSERAFAEVESSRPTPLSMMCELASESYDFAIAALDLQSRLLRPREQWLQSEGFLGGLRRLMPEQAALSALTSDQPIQSGIAPANRDGSHDHFD